jgi:hypothetical protein
MKARSEDVEGVCERRGTLRVEAGDDRLFDRTPPARAVVLSVRPPTLS